MLAFPFSCQFLLSLFVLLTAFVRFHSAIHQLEPVRIENSEMLTFTLVFPFVPLGANSRFLPLFPATTYTLFVLAFALWPSTH